MSIDIENRKKFCLQQAAVLDSNLNEKAIFPQRNAVMKSFVRALLLLKKTKIC